MWDKPVATRADGLFQSNICPSNDWDSYSFLALDLGRRDGERLLLQSAATQVDVAAFGYQLVKKVEARRPLAASIKREAVHRTASAKVD